MWNWSWLNCLHELVVGWGGVPLSTGSHVHFPGWWRCSCPDQVCLPACAPGYRTGVWGALHLSPVKASGFLCLWSKGGNSRPVPMACYRPNSVPACPVGKGAASSPLYLGKRLIFGICQIGVWVPVPTFHLLPPSSLLHNCQLSIVTGQPFLCSTPRCWQQAVFLLEFEPCYFEINWQSHPPAVALQDWVGRGDSPLWFTHHDDCGRGHLGKCLMFSPLSLTLLVTSKVAFTASLPTSTATQVFQPHWGWSLVSGSVLVFCSSEFLFFLLLWKYSCESHVF